MKTLKKNQSGFGAVEMILVLVIVAVLGAVGWFVYDRQRSNTQTTNDVTNQEQPKEDFTYTGVNIPSDWKTYENDKYGFSYQYPANFSISESSFNTGESADNAVFTAQANPPAEQGVGGYEVRVLKTSLDDAVKDDGLTVNDNEFENTISQKSVFKNGYKTVELSYVPSSGKVSWFFIEKDRDTVIRFELVEDSGVNAAESKAIYNSLIIK